MIKNLLKENIAYREVASSYSVKDGMMALGLFAVATFSYCLGLFAYLQIGFSVNILVSTVILSSIFILLRLRKQKLASVGITKNNFFKSLLVGSVLGVIVLIVRMQSGSLMDFSYDNFSISHIYSIFYFFLIISLTEEILFRGYIQTRIYGIAKSKFSAIIVVGMLCALTHVIVDLVAYNLIENYVARGWSILGLVISHIFFNLLYAKYNNLIGPVILHGFVNLRFFIN